MNSLYDIHDEYYMRLALDEARAAADDGEIPIGAVVVDSAGNIIGRGHNRTESLCDVTAHAEMQAISAAASTLGGKYLVGCTLYVTVEPCPMCAGAIGWSQLRRIVTGAPDAKRGYSVLQRPGKSFFHPKATVTQGVLEDECASLMRAFFIRRR